MSLRRKQLNISLFILTLILGVSAVCLNRQPALFLSTQADDPLTDTPSDSIVSDYQQLDTTLVEVPETNVAVKSESATPVGETAALHIKASDFGNAEPRDMIGDHPFKTEAAKVLSGRLEETDSLSRRKILSYCEHLRTAYTSRDIDFIRQVFSDNALIIVGHVVKTGRDNSAATGVSDKVKYSIRSKQEYVKRLARIFETKKKIDVNFDDFSIMRHPTMPGIYGVTLRQQYSADNYSDDGYLFLLWDFRNPSMPLIHVRTWQPAASGDDLIDLSDFNLN